MHFLIARHLGLSMARNVVIKLTLGIAVALFTSIAMNARDLGQWDDPANADLKR